jgi:hypothetical protein
MRVLTWTLLALLGATAPIAVVVAQNPLAPAPNARALEEWRARLSDADLARREQAFERLIQAVRQDPSLAGLLREWASDAANPELAWTARLALRELGRAPAFAFPEIFQAPGLFHSPGHSWLPDPWSNLGNGLSMPLSLDGGSAFESLQYSQGPEGVSIRVETETNGQRETKTYKGQTLEEILEANPELAEKLSGGRSTLKRAPSIGPWTPRSETEAPAPLRTDKLGVIAREPTAAERGRAGLSQGGLAIDHVAAGTIAEVLGLRPGAILVEINGRAIDSVEALSAALAERAPEGELRVTLFDASGRRQTRTWRPAPPGPARSASGS